MNTLQVLYASRQIIISNDAYDASQRYPLYF